MEVPRQLEATRWMDFDFHVARSFLRISIWRVAQIHLARVYIRRLYSWKIPHVHIHHDHDDEENDDGNEMVLTILMINR